MTRDSQSSALPPPLAYPDPVVQYSMREDGTSIEAVNDAFRAAFGSVNSGMALEEVLDITSPGDRTTLETGGTLTVTPDCTTADSDAVRATEQPSPSKHYHGRVVPPDDQPGYIVFVECTHEVGVDHVASVISHDLRNPLDVAKAHLEAIDDGVSDTQSAIPAELSTHITHIENAHGRMERIIEDVLTLARGGDVITPDSTVELEAVANCAWDTVDTAGATLRFDDSLQSVTGDRDRLTRLFENLFRNSVEHGSSDSETVTVRVGALPDGFYVEDDGPGIEPERREEIFEPGRTETAQGTGLGLAIVDRIVTHHGWSVAANEGSAGGARIEIRGVTDV